jgi:hypothetical protein
MVDLSVTEWFHLAKTVPAHKGWYQCARVVGPRGRPGTFCYRYWNGERFSLGESSLHDERRLSVSKAFLIPSWADLYWRGLLSPASGRRRATAAAVASAPAAAGSAATALAATAVSTTNASTSVPAATPE